MDRRSTPPTQAASKTGDGHDAGNRGGALRPHPDRILPIDPSARSIARRLYDSVRDLPLISPHGHIDPELLAADRPFDDPASLLVTPDHYVTRLLHAHGTPLHQLGLRDSAGEIPAAPREVWRTFCSHWHHFLGTASRQWLEAELHDVLGVRVQPCSDNADALFDELVGKLAEPGLRPRALYKSFNIAVLATTDDPADDLKHHRALADDPTWSGRVVPTFRPDRYLNAACPDWSDDLDRLAASSGIDTGTYRGTIRALEARRAFFAENGATATDHSAPDARMVFLPEQEASSLFDRVRTGNAEKHEAEMLSRHMLGEMARMSSEDGLVMALHTGSRRNHHPETHARYGGDTGHDIPLQAEFTRSLQPMLDRFGTHPRFQTVLFTLDETTFSRELAPLAGFYPSVYLGAPWWFLDAPRAMRRFRDAVTETAGFHRTAGFIDDTRGFCSIPARHDTARRVDAGHLASLVAEHLVSEEDAAQVLHDLNDHLPRSAFRL